MTYAWLTDNLQGILWEAESYDHTFIFNFFNALKLRFPNSTVFTKGTENEKFFLQYGLWSFWTLLVVPKYLSLAIVQQEFVRIIKSYKLKHCAREKVALSCNWLFNFKDPIMNAVDATAKENTYS